MEFSTLVKERHSVRAYQTRPVEEEKLRALLEAANDAPSAGNLQAFEIVVVKEVGTRAALARAALNQSFIASAPVVLLFFANPARSTPTYGRRGADLYCVQDASVACTFAHLRAADLGLGSVWVGAFDDQAISRVVKAPPEMRPVAILPVGYPAEPPSPTPRRRLQDLVREETF